MAKKLIFILVMALVLGALALGLFLLNRPAKAAEEAPPVLPDVEYIIDYRDEKYGGLASVTVSNEKGEYTVFPGDPPSIPGWEALITSTYSLTRILDSCASLSSRGLVVEEGDVAVYGLDTPRARAEIKTASGEGTTLFIGADVPDGAGIYVRLDGSSAIYQAGKWEMDYFFQGVFDFVGKELSPQLPDDGYGGFEFGEIILGGAVRPDGPVRVIHQEQTEVQPGRISNAYRISGPIEASLNLDKGYTILKSLPGINADRAVARLSGDEDLARYGLDKPYSTASVTGTLGQGLGGFSLLASKPDADGNVYICSQGGSLIYQMAASALPWLETGWWDLMDKMIILPFIDDIAQVELSFPGRRVNFNLSGEGDDLKVEAGGVVLDTKFFRSYYQSLLSAVYDEYTSDKIPPGAQPVMEIVYRYRDGRPPDRVSFYASSSRRVFTSLNGGRPFYTYSAYITKVQNDLDQLLEGKKVLPYL
ncbi:MAG: DUF4340 domain-containing protein [Treponema sp.]|jgi:hypothetical protein|nr:DUF4340 domain-containing protein [Treponema sp.]